MKQQATTFINDNRVNDSSHNSTWYLKKEKQLYCSIYIRNMLPIDICINHTGDIK